jgi:peptidyl-prolyl cis-trans isomerase SurA
MTNKILIAVSIYFLSTFAFSDLKSQIKNRIVVKVGNSLISSIDVENEIITNLVLSNQMITQENINKNKDFSLKNLINKSIKRNEINKYKVKEFSKKDLEKHIQDIAKKINTDVDGLKEIFKIHNINYNLLVKNHETELLWNSLIFNLYQNQMNINIVEVENEIENTRNINKTEYNLSEIEITKLEYNENTREKILEQIKINGFEETAKKISISSTAKKGGLIGWVAEKSLTKKYSEEIKKIQIKDISSPILSKNSVSFIKINDIRKDKNDVNEIALKNKILEQKKQEKLRLFSRSHFSNLENTISIIFQ